MLGINKEGEFLGIHSSFELNPLYFSAVQQKFISLGTQKRYLEQLYREKTRINDRNYN